MTEKAGARHIWEAAGSFVYETTVAYQLLHINQKLQGIAGLKGFLCQQLYKLISRCFNKPPQAHLPAHFDMFQHIADDGVKQHNLQPTNLSLSQSFCLLFSLLLFRKSNPRVITTMATVRLSAVKTTWMTTAPGTLLKPHSEWILCVYVCCCLPTASGWALGPASHSRVLMQPLETMHEFVFFCQCHNWHCLVFGRLTLVLPLFSSKWCSNVEKKY